MKLKIKRPGLSVEKQQTNFQNIYRLVKSILVDFNFNNRHLKPSGQFLNIKNNLNVNYLQCISRSYSYSMKAYPLGLPSILLCVTTIYINEIQQQVNINTEFLNKIISIIYLFYRTVKFKFSS